VDSTVCEVHGHAKGGAAYGYTKVLGYHPLLATRADTGEVVHLRMRKGSANTARGGERFVNETAGRIRRAGAPGPTTVRADSGFWSAKVLAACRRHRLRYSITVRHTAPVAAAIAAIEEAAWVDITYPDGGAAQVAETRLPGPAGGRLIVRRTRLVGPQATLWPDWRHHAFVTDRPGTAVELDADHRRHAVVELAIRDLKQGAGMRHCPSGRFLANAAWAVIATLAHNLLRWVAALGLGASGPVVAKTLRRRLLTLPGRLTRSARRRYLHLPAGWPWAKAFTGALARLQALPLLA
jgi:Transposase DDE domain group 1